jgi:hypothetical protein
VNKDAKEYWKGPFLEQRSFIQNRHYYFELSADKGKENGYQALRKLFTTQSSICDKTLIHCDTLITLVKTLAYADIIGEQQFNERIKSGQMNMWLTYDGMSIKEKDVSETPVAVSYYTFEPSNKKDLIIGDHVVFWNHQGYDAITVKYPGPWRLENAVLVDKDSAGNDLFEGHGAGPVTEKGMHQELMKAYNPFARDALSVVKKIEDKTPGADKELSERYPQVKKVNNQWQIEELERNKDRPQHFYVLREITDPNDIELIGLRNPYHPDRMSSVKRPVESK